MIASWNAYRAMRKSFAANALSPSAIFAAGSTAPGGGCFATPPLASCTMVFDPTASADADAVGSETALDAEAGEDVDGATIGGAIAGGLNAAVAAAAFC